jgi:hypothetical protein
MLTANGKAICKITNAITRPNYTYLIPDEGDVQNFFNSGSNVQFFNEMLAGMHIVVGSGNTAPASSDKALESEVTDLTVITTNGTNTADAASYEQDYIAIFSRTYRNDTESDVVISEVGVQCYAHCSNVAPLADFLFARDVISPVTIKPGEAYTFTMYIG